MIRRGSVVAAIGLALVAVLVPATADAASTAKVRDVDNYNHGKVRVYVDGVERTVAYGQRTAFFTITPSKSGNDGVSVQSVRYTSCGESSVSNYFDAGHTYRVVVYHPDGLRCHLSDGSWFPGPGFRVVKIS